MQCKRVRSKCQFEVYCSLFSDRNLRGDAIPTLLRLKLLQACDQWHSARVFTALTGSHCKFRLNTKGFFQLKAITGDAAQLLIQLKVNDELPANFEYCEARVPFFGRGKIVDVEASPGVGTVTVVDDGTTILWRMGPRPKVKELTLPATIRFKPKPAPAEEHTAAAATPATATGGQEQDPFITGPNAYVSISFHVNNYSMGGCNVDSSSVASSGGSKVKLHVATEFTTGEYIIWNSLGKSRRVVYGARFSTGIYSRGCHWFPRLCSA
jgi:hypothetical protein